VLTSPGFAERAAGFTGRLQRGGEKPPRASRPFIRQGVVDPSSETDVCWVRVRNWQVDIHVRDRNADVTDVQAFGMHVVVNAAMSVDGKLAARTREQLAISGPEDFDRVDRIRAAADGVMVGVGTVLADNPHLTLDVTDRRVQRQRHGSIGQSGPRRRRLDSANAD